MPAFPAGPDAVLGLMAVRAGWGEAVDGRVGGEGCGCVARGCSRAGWLVLRLGGGGGGVPGESVGDSIRGVMVSWRESIPRTRSPQSETLEVLELQLTRAGGRPFQTRPAMIFCF